VSLTNLSGVDEEQTPSCVSGCERLEQHGSSDFMVRQYRALEDGRTPLLAVVTWDRMVEVFGRPQGHYVEIP
jgi:hypothetical protein